MTGDGSSSKAAPAAKIRRVTRAAETPDTSKAARDTAKEMADCAATPVPLPRIPKDGSESSAATPARSVLSGVVPWVQQSLREYMKSHKELFNASGDHPLCEHQPLEIKSTISKTTALKSYKAPWNQNSAADSLATTGMYEAGGNVCWVRVFPLNKEMEVVAGGPLQWAQITGLADQFISERAYACAATPEVASDVPQILFPVTLFVNAQRDVSMSSSQYFQGSLDLISGHAYLYAWWYAMFQALRDDAATLVASLWQCGLTATLHLRQGLDLKQMATISCEQSELHKASKSKVSDTFPAFALKALLIAPAGGAETGRTTILQGAGITYNGAPVNKVFAAGSVERYCECVVCVCVCVFVSACSRVPQRHDVHLSTHHGTSNNPSTERVADNR